MLPMRSRRGFTLIEVVFAVVLIDVGLLALVAASATLVRRAGDLRARDTALRAATDRLQLLGATPCAGQSGSATSAGIREAWTVSAPRNGSRELRDSVVFATTRGIGAVVLRTRLPC